MSKKKSDNQKHDLMAITIKPVVDLIENRLNSRLSVLETLSAQPLDSGIPESIKLRREEEAAKIRVVIQEQRDLIATIKALYPNV